MNIIIFKKGHCHGRACASFSNPNQSRPQSSSLLRMTDDGNISGQSDFRSSADWLLKHNSITTGSEDDTGKQRWLNLGKRQQKQRSGFVGRATETSW